VQLRTLKTATEIKFIRFVKEKESAMKKIETEIAVES